MRSFIAHEWVRWVAIPYNRATLISAMWSAEKTRTALICFAALLASFVSVPFLGVAQNTSQATQQPLLIVRERVSVQPVVGSLPCMEGRVHHGFSYSVITVFTNGKGTNVAWDVPPCSEPARAIGWTVPAYGKTQNFALSQSTLAQLRNFLDSPEVARLRDSMSATTGVGDYDIEIQHASGAQRIPVMGLGPHSDELKRDPTLLLLICKAKEIAGDERQPWCPNPPQAEPVGAR